MKIKNELLKYKHHPRIMELRISMIKTMIVRQYGEEVAMNFLQMLSQMFECNWTVLIGILNKDHKITNHPAVTATRRKQEVILMGALYGETRYQISAQYLNMSTNYLYQSKERNNPNIYTTEEWLETLNDEVVVCGVRSYATEARRFLVSFDNFMGIFK